MKTHYIRLKEIETYLQEINSCTMQKIHIDTLRYNFDRRYKLEALREVGEWIKVSKNTPLYKKLKKRVSDAEIKTAYTLKEHNSIYYYNLTRGTYRDRSVLVIYGLKQYHKEAPPREVITSIDKILKRVDEVDICIDTEAAPQMQHIKRIHPPKKIDRGRGVTYYFNNLHNERVDRIVIYDKAQKNGLGGTLWRFEATVAPSKMPNYKELLPISAIQSYFDAIFTGEV